MHLVDLSQPIDATLRESLPPVASFYGAAAAYPARTIAPAVEVYAPDAEGADLFAAAFGVPREDLPGGEGWGEEIYSGFSSHVGTHVDAPLHYGTTCEGRPARSISDIDLSELYCDGTVLDVRNLVAGGEGIPVDVLVKLVEKLDTPISAGSAILIRTGGESFTPLDEGYHSYPGMTREGTLYLESLGAKVLGTDARGWDRPFAAMRAAYEATGNVEELWDGHRAGREKEIFIVQKLTNLASLPVQGFKVAFFPLRLIGASAAPARVVAFVED